VLIAPPTPTLLAISDNKPTPSTIPALPTRWHRSARTQVILLRIHSRPQATPLTRTSTSVLVVSLPSAHSLSMIPVPQLAAPARHTGPTPTHLSSSPTPSSSHNTHPPLPPTHTSPLLFTDVPILKQRQRPLLPPPRRPIPSRMRPLFLPHQFIPRRTQWTLVVLIFLLQRF
jgi:hypothetical protein